MGCLGAANTLVGLHTPFRERGPGRAVSLNVGTTLELSGQCEGKCVGVGIGKTAKTVFLH